MDETYIKVKRIWKCLYRAVDKKGKTIDFLVKFECAPTTRRLYVALREVSRQHLWPEPYAVVLQVRICAGGGG